MSFEDKEKISVVFSFNHLKNQFFIHKIFWREKVYLIKKITYHQKLYQGKTLVHIFYLTDNEKDFKVIFDSDSLNWYLEKYYERDLF